MNKPCFHRPLTDRLRFSAIVLSASLIVGVASNSLAATSIGANFQGRGGDGNPVPGLAPSESAGVVPQTQWNNIDSGGTFKGSTLGLLDSAANFTSVKIIFDASDSWNSDGGSTTTDDRLMKGIIKANPTPDIGATDNSDRMQFVITNLPAGTYNVLVYNIDNGPTPTAQAEADISIGATTYYVEQEASFAAAGGYIRATSTIPGTYGDANYAEFDGVSPIAGAITVIARKHVVDPQQTDGIGVAAIQIVQVTGGAYPPNTDTCSITAQPSSTLAVAGGTATFSVGTAGPCKIQWTKNGTAIPGKTDAILLYSPVVADDGALIRAVVYNNVITNTSSAATLSVDPNTPETLTQGFLRVDRYENIGGNTGTSGLDDLKTAIGAGGPTTTFFVGGPNVPQTSPNIANFGVRVWGWVKPTVSGDYDFFIRSDDSSELYLDSTAAAGSGTNTLPDFTVDSPIAFEYGCCNAFREPDPLVLPNQTTTSPITLTAGKLYGIVVLMKEGGGGDFVQVAWRRVGDTTPAGSLLTIPSANSFTMATPAGQRASITTQPVSATVLQGRQTTFTVGVATTPVAGTYSLQWLKNGTAIPGATGTAYTIPPAASPGDNGALFSVQALTLRGVLTSANATLTVTPDTFPPIPAAGTITRNDGVVEVGIGFDEPVNVATLISANFSVVGISTTFKLATNSFNDYQGVVLDATGITAGNTYTARVQNVSDIYGNAMPLTSLTFTLSPVKWAESGLPVRPGQVVPVGATGFDVLNGGREEWSSYDEVTMAYVKKTNDFDVQVQVVYAEPSSQWSRVGLEARNGLDVGEDPGDRSLTGSGSTASAYAQTHVNPNQTLASSGRFDPTGATPVNPTPNNGHEQNQRLAAGIATSGWGSAGTAPVYPNVWLRLKRAGTTLQGFRSTDGINWTDQGTTTLTDQQPDMFVGPSMGVETGNIWAGADHDVWAGPFDPKYDRLFVAQFRNFTDVPALNIGVVAGRPTVTFSGVLQSSTTVDGGYTDVPGATSPYTVPIGSATGFYRIRGSISQR